MSKQHITLMAGGTGGHIMPALAVAEVLREKGHEVSWLGSNGGMEESLVTKHAIDFYGLPIKGLRGNGLRGWLIAPFKIIKSVWQARQVLRQLMPQCVLSMGGFAAGPGGLAARTLRIPLIVHEQNKIPGLTNKALARFATLICQGFADSFHHYSGVKTVGNPVRKAISELSEKKLLGDEQTLNLLILGGSQGAKALNEYIPKLLGTLENGDIKIHHQCGQRWLAQCEEHYAVNKLNTVDVKLEAFIDDMAAAYKWADVVIARAGAMTISELACAGVASILVPFPYAVDDHQTANAQAMQAAGAAIVITEVDLQTPATQQQILELLSDHPQLKVMAEAAHGLAKPDAATEMAEICLSVGAKA